LTSTGSLQILKASPATTLQDIGRRGYQKLGLAQGGAADLHAFLWANQLLDNRVNSATIEVVLGQFEARFTQATNMSVCGADAQLHINQEPRPLWQSMRVEKGDQIRLSLPRRGLINYLAIEGGFQFEPVFGSAATVLRESTGPFQGKALCEGMSLGFFQRPALRQRSTPLAFQPDYRAPLRLRWIPGQQVDMFDSEQIDALCQTTLKISANSNRMGYRLHGFSLNALESRSHFESEGIAFGSIQVPPNGEPIVLLNDRQTLGGYPKIGCVASLDCYRLSQLRPGQEVYFEKANIDECEEELAEFLHYFER
jgi:biotin-dependent carboxylase-like uncharacterized protein